MEPESPRTSLRKPYGYAANASPWNTKVVIGLWIAQAGFSVLCCIVGGALVPSKNDEHRGDDGDSNTIYLM
jgi:hypothetical protein